MTPSISLKSLTVGSLFSGIGGFDKGFHEAGFEILWQVEIDKYARQVLQTHFTAPIYEDVRHVGKHNLSAIDVLVGGSPCQDVSVAGRRAGLAGERSGLFFEFVRILEELRPRWFVFENVPGLLSSHGGRDFATVLLSLAKCGYGVAYRILDAQHFGVAQRRRRVFVVGHLGDGRATQVLFERESGNRNTSPRSKSGQDNSRDTKGSFTNGSVSGTLAASGAGTIRAAGNANELDFIVADISGTMTSTYRATGDQNGDYTKLVGHVPDISKAILTREGMRQDTEVETYIGNDYGVRRLMPIECERLQGFPDNWTESQSDAQRYKQLGNAVCVPVARWIAQRIVEVEQSQR